MSLIREVLSGAVIEGESLIILQSVQEKKGNKLETAGIGKL